MKSEFKDRGEAFLEALERNAKLLFPAAQKVFEGRKEVCSWLLDPLATWAQKAYGESAFDEAARGYAKYCFDVAKSQQLYEREGKYKPQDFPDVVSEVYGDEGYMIPYMWAAILIYALWPSMVKHLSLLRDDFLAQLPRNAKVIELASGHGVLGLLAAEHRPDIRLVGVDISPPAVAVANRLLSASGHGGRVSFVVRDALDFEGRKDRGLYQGVIAAMLAEHLEDPSRLFEAIAHYLAEDGLAFFSTAIESAQRDHIYEFNWESEPLRMAEKAGLRVSTLISEATSPRPNARFLPRAMAMIIRRR